VKAIVNPVAAQDVIHRMNRRYIPESTYSRAKSREARTSRHSSPVQQHQPQALSQPLVGVPKQDYCTNKWIKANKIVRRRRQEAEKDPSLTQERALFDFHRMSIALAASCNEINRV